jgi:hypothetical protein
MKLAYCARGFVFLSILTTAFLASAQTRYSVNAIGYVDARFYAGSNLMANPLAAVNNSISNLLAELPSGSFYLPWNPASREFGPANHYTSETGWTAPDATLLRRDAGFLWLPEGRTVSFVGEPWPGTCIQYPPGISVSGVLPKYACGFCANFNDCQITPEIQITQWDRATQRFVTTEYVLDFGWIPAEPTLALDEAAMFYNPGFTIQARWFGPSTIGAVPLFNPRLKGTNFYFEFPSFNGVSYSVQRSGNLSDGPWETILTATTTTSDAFISVEVPRMGKASFYRLHALRLTNPVRGEATFQFQFYAEAGTQYQISRSASIPATAWQPVGSVEGEGKVMTFTDPAAEASVAYYRVAY